MYQTDKIIDKAKQLGLNVSENNNQLDTLRSIASQLGMPNFDLDRSDELEQLLDDKLNSQNNNGNVNMSLFNIENLNAYPQDNHYYNTQNDGVPSSRNISNESSALPSSDNTNNENEGVSSLDNTSNENNGQSDNSKKKSYKDEKKELEEKKAQAQENKQKVSENKQNALENKKKAKGTEGSWEANQKYKEANKESRQANKDLRKANRDLANSKINHAKDIANIASDPVGAAKEKAGDVIKDTAKQGVKKAGQAAGQAAKAGVQAVGHAIATFVAANPWILVVLLVLVIILFVLFLIIIEDDDDSIEGYYAKTCNFTVLNESELIYVTFGGLNASDSEESFDYDEYTLKSLVSLKAYYQLSEINYSELSNSVIEAYLVLVQTNIIFASWDDPTSEDGNIHYQASDDLRCVQYLMDTENNSEYASYCYGYTGGEFDESLYEKIQNLYDSVESNIFVSSDYGGYFRQETAYDGDYISYSNSELESMLYTFESYGSSNVETILTTYYQNDYYNNLYADYYLFSVEEDCAYYTLTDNTSYWWPIGSADATDTVNGVEIYGGTPTSTVINSSFGSRDMSDYGGSSSNQHNGIDIDGEMGETIVIAALSGTVIATNDTCSSTGSYGSTCGGGLGNYVKIEHEDGTVTIYGHMYQGSITVSENDTVEQGQMIGLVGSSGSSTGAHLHFGVQVNGEYVDPLDFVSAQNPRPVVSSSSTTYVSGSTNKQTICLTLKTSYDDTAVAALMVNIFAESGYKTTDIGDSGTSYGLCQWHESRYEELQEYCGDEIDSVECQLNYLEYELTNKYPEIKKYLNSSTYTAYKKTVYFCENFERPSEATRVCANRATNYTELIYTYVQNGCSE